MDEQPGSTGEARGSVGAEYARRWFAAGLITDDQRRSIIAFEEQAAGRPPRRLTTVAEIATYLGGVIAFAAGAAVVAPNWDRLGLVGQVGLAAAIALVGFLGGRVLTRLGESGTDRVGGFLVVVGTGGTALAAAAVVGEIDPRDQAWFPFMIGLVVAAVSAALWRNLDRPLQVATTGVGLTTMVVGGAELVDADTAVLATVIWIGAGAVGVAGATGRLRPRLVTIALASIGLMIGSFVYMDTNERFAAVLAVVTAAVIVAFSMVEKSVPLITIGVVSFFVATISLMQTVLHGMTERLVAALLGLLVVAVVAFRAQRLSGPGTSGTA